MRPATLVHLSDLHFGVNGQSSVWKSLKNYINDEIKPDLAIITGDIVNSPTKKAFDNALSELSQLNCRHPKKMLVCPGNHDRHWRGNALGPFTPWFLSAWMARSSAASFNEVFKGHLTGLEQSIDLSFQSGSYTWCVRFAALDSAINAKYAAQGFVTLEDLQELKKVRANIGEVDAVFLLMHHHLLPISGTERADQAMTDIVSGTTVVNAGTTLAAVVTSQVNLVLHGHEHRRNVARYGTFGAGQREQGETVILGSGSSTGVVTSKPCDPRIASSNLIELREDQSIWVKELRYDDGGWSVRDGTATCIVPTIDLRRSKFFRRAGDAQVSPSSEVVKHVRFTPQRDALFRETRTDWLVSGKEFAVPTRNLSGFPVRPKVELALPRGVGIRPLSADGFERVANEPGAHVYRIELSVPGPTFVPRIDLSYEWIDGAMLCRQDLDLIPPGRRGPFREDGFEFVAISVTNDLRAFELHVHLPAGFWPDVADGANLKVCVQELSKADPPEERSYLKEHVSASGPGTLIFSVPYPIRGYRYILAWRLPDAEAATQQAVQLRKVLREWAQESLQAFMAGIADAPWADLVSVSLYLPEQGRGGVPMVRRVAHLAAARAVGRAPREWVSLRDNEVPYLEAWWDGAGTDFSQAGARPDAEAIEAGILEGERWQFVLPVRELGAKPGGVPAALLRIGIAEAIAEHGLATPVAAERFTAVWDKGLLSLLYAASLRL